MEESNLLWKEKALQRRAENKELMKRKKELTKSRDNWKRKHTVQKSRADSLEKDLIAIKKKLNEIILE